MDPERVERLLSELAALRDALERERQAQATDPLDVDRAAWLAGILAHSPDVISILDPEGRLLYVSRVMTSRPMAEVMGKNARELVPESSRPAWGEAFDRAIATGRPQHVTLLSNGEYWWDTRLAPITEDGRIAYVLSIGTDITARKKAEAALEVKEQQLHLALEASGMGQWWWSIADDSVAWDTTAKRIFGWPLERDDITYASFLERVHPAERERAREHIERAVATAVYPPLECRIVLPDGSERWLWITGRVVTSGDGRASALVGGLLDITRAKETDAQIQRARKLEAIGQLAGGIAHDFNNLLVAIMGNLELAKSTTEAAEREELLDEALAASSRAADLTRQLLAFSRRQPLHETVIELHALIEDTLRLLRRLVPESISIELLRAHLPPRVHGDRGQIEQVLVNLCLNARDAMPKGGRLVIETEIVVVNGSFRETHPWAEPGRYALVTVSDTGHGIAPAHIDRIFEPFFTTKPQGTGLGLATSYGIVKQHGGLLHVYSEEGTGTTFKVYLPLAERLAAEVGSKIGDRVRGGSERVLVAEDEAPVRAVVVRILEGAGYRVTQARDGLEASQIFARDPSAFDLAILDAVMPQRSGAELAAEIRALRPDMTIVLSSGYSDALAAHAVASGDVAFLAKPYEPDALLRVVRAQLDAKRG